MSDNREGIRLWLSSVADWPWSGLPVRGSLSLREIVGVTLSICLRCGTVCFVTSMSLLLPGLACSCGLLQQAWSYKAL